MQLETQQKMVRMHAHVSPMQESRMDFLAVAESWEVIQTDDHTCPPSSLFPIQTNASFKK